MRHQAAACAIGDARAPFADARLTDVPDRWPLDDAEGIRLVVLSGRLCRGE